MDYQVANFEMVFSGEKLEFSKAGNEYRIGFTWRDSENNKNYTHIRVKDHSRAVMVYNKMLGILLNYLYTNKQREEILKEMGE